MSAAYRLALYKHTFDEEPYEVIWFVDDDELRTWLVERQHEPLTFQLEKVEEDLEPYYSSTWEHVATNIMLYAMWLLVVFLFFWAIAIVVTR